MTTLYNVPTTVQGINGFGSPFCATIYSATLAAATNTTLTVPGKAAIGMGSATPTKNRYLAVFSYAPSSKVWVANNATATVPAGASFTATSSELNPPAKIVAAADVINMICTAGADVSIALYSLQEN
jgi:hypothetical protein